MTVVSVFVLSTVSIFAQRETTKPFKPTDPKTTIPFVPEVPKATKSELLKRFKLDVTTIPFVPEAPKLTIPIAPEVPKTITLERPKGTKPEESFASRVLKA